MSVGTREFLDTKEFFRPLEGTTYPSYKALEERIWQRYNELRSRLPADYTFEDLLAWMFDHHFIIQDDAQRYKFASNGNGYKR